MAGRPGDDRPGAEPVVIIERSLWRSRYESAPDVLGRVLRVNGVASTVVGVMPDGFDFPQASAVWQPLALLPESAIDRRSSRGLIGVGRLVQGVTIEQALADLQGIAAGLARASSSSRG